MLVLGEEHLTAVGLHQHGGGALGGQIASQSRRRQDDGVQFRLVGQFLQARGDVAADFDDVEVGPLKQQLDTYQKRLQQSETAQSGALGELKKQLETLAQQSQSLSSETLQLRRVLSSNQARGRWGEETLRRVVEAAGLSAHCDFSEQIQSGDSKPDLIVHLPGERVIIVDAKVPDLDFLQAVDSADTAKRAEALAARSEERRVGKECRSRWSPYH